MVVDNYYDNIGNFDRLSEQILVIVNRKQKNIMKQ